MKISKSPLVRRKLLSCGSITSGRIKNKEGKYTGLGLLWVSEFPEDATAGEFLAKNKINRIEQNRTWWNDFTEARKAPKHPWKEKRGRRDANDLSLGR